MSRSFCSICNDTLLVVVDGHELPCPECCSPIEYYILGDGPPDTEKAPPMNEDDDDY